ncbi:MAG: hypothetical protein QOJ12_3113 [Thermoleophilales bacterium]|nr:hypothetical protein [Thermoleophilales bacterium]
MPVAADTQDMAEYRTDIVIRRASAADTHTLWRLAALDDAPAPIAGPHVLIAEIAGEAVAAIAGGRAIADPFQRTAAIVELLQLRAQQIEPAAPAPRGLERLSPRPLAHA